MDEITFIDALKNKDKEQMKLFEKADLHNHAVFSCDRKYLNENNIHISENDKINNISDLISFARKYIKPLQNDERGLEVLLNGTFYKCIESGVTKVDTDIDYKICIQVFNSNVNKFIQFLKRFKYHSLDIRWIIDISRDSYLEEYEKIIIELINSKFFAGIDLTSTENCKPNSLFKNIYKHANKQNLITKIHCGEQLDASYVRDCILDFNPKQIQHGISIVEDPETMALARERNIVFNVCPTSNVLLHYAKNYSEHPIAQMVKNNLKVTIGTDDYLLFESDINDEYLKLYEHNILNASQLEKIRLFSISL